MAAAARSAVTALPLRFDAGPLTVVDDAEGGIRYWPALVDREDCEGWFMALRDGIAWHSEQRPMYDRIVDVPRLQASVDLSDPEAPPQLQEALRAIRRDVAAPFTHAGLNYYRDGRDSVAMHNDRIQFLQPGAPIAILSLGAPRDMLVRRKGRGGSAQRITLEPGSLLVMSHASQRTHEHGIPKTRQPVGPRISCAFRVRGPRPCGGMA